MISDSKKVILLSNLNRLHYNFIHDMMSHRFGHEINKFGKLTILLNFIDTCAILNVTQFIF